MIEVHLVRVSYDEYKYFWQEPLVFLATKERAEGIRDELENIMNDHCKQKAIKKWGDKHFTNRYINKINKVPKADNLMGPF